MEGVSESRPATSRLEGDRGCKMSGHGLSMPSFCTGYSSPARERECSWATVGHPAAVGSLLDKRIHILTLQKGWSTEYVTQEGYTL